MLRGMVGLLRGSASIRAGGGIGRRVTVVVLALLALQVGSLVAPAHACGCGALIPGDRQRVNVGREVSLVRWDGRQEQIVMSLQIGGDARQAAWIMPVPNRATVQLGDPGLFDELAAATAPCTAPGTTSGRRTATGRSPRATARWGHRRPAWAPAHRPTWDWSAASGSGPSTWPC